MIVFICTYTIKHCYTALFQTMNRCLPTFFIHGNGNANAFLFVHMITCSNVSQLVNFICTFLYADTLQFMVQSNGNEFESNEMACCHLKYRKIRGAVVVEKCNFSNDHRTQHKRRSIFSSFTVWRYGRMLPNARSHLSMSLSIAFIGIVPFFGQITLQSFILLQIQSRSTESECPNISNDTLCKWHKCPLCSSECIAKRLFGGTFFWSALRCELIAMMSTLARFFC